MSVPLESALAVLYYAYPSTVFVYFVLSSLTSVFTSQPRTGANRDTAKPSRSWLTVILLGIFVSTYIVQAIVTAVRSFIHRDSPAATPVHEDLVVGRLSCILIFGLQLSRLIDDPYPVWYPFGGSWVLALTFEILIDSLATATKSWSAPFVFSIIDLISAGLRCLLLLCLLCSAYVQLSVEPKGIDEERQVLIPKDTASQTRGSQEQSHSYGSTLQAEEDSLEADDEYSWERAEVRAREAMEKRLVAGGNWLQYAKGFAVGLFTLHHYNCK